MTSIRDVAKKAGVAVSTVSKVLNHYPNVTEETRQKVTQAIEELNFVPNTIAAALSSKQSGRVALLINMNIGTKAINEIDMQYIAGAIHKAEELKLDVITVFFSMLKGKTLEEVISYFKSQNITGMVIYGLSKDDLVIHQLIESKIFKLVVVDAPMTNSSTSAIWVNQEEAQYQVAKKTITENKCKKILYLAGKGNGYVTEERIKGIERLAKEKKLKLQIECGDFSEAKARELTFRYAKAVDAVICASDMMAIGAMRALVEMDIFLPVCGVDGITLMGYAGKQMNTIMQDFFNISAEALEELKRLLQGNEGRMIYMPYHIERLQYLDIIC